MREKGAGKNKLPCQPRRSGSLLLSAAGAAVLASIWPGYKDKRILLPIFFIKRKCITLARVAHWVGRYLRKPQGCRFDSPSGHMPGCWVRSQFGHVEKTMGRCFSASLALSLPQSLKISKHVLG